MHKKISVGMCIALVILAVAIACAATVPITMLFINGKLTNFSKRQDIVDKIIEIDSKVRDNFLYELDEDALISAAAKGYMSGLGDQYADYYNADGFADKQQKDKGQVVSLGVSIAKHPDSDELQVLYVNRKSPAHTAGLQKGDIITKINGNETKPRTRDECVALITYEVNTKVELELIRGGKTLTANAVLVAYEADSVNWRVIDGVGYIQITTFDATTSPQFEQGLAELQKAHVKGLVFDLRNNGGGSVEAVAKVLDTLLPAGNLVTLRYKGGRTEVTQKSGANEVSLPMAVLVNEGTASSAEIFAMNIRDYQKGPLVGTKTFGKGIVQTTYTLKNETAVKFTTAEIIDKNGVTYHGKGFDPDISVPLSEEQHKYYAFLADKDDPQLVEAVKAVNK